MLPPDARVRLRDVEIGKADRVICRDVQLEILARRKGDRFGWTGRFQNEFLDEGGDIAIADDPETIGLMGAGTGASRAENVKVQTPVAFFDRVGRKAAADRRAGGRAIGEVEPSVVLRTLDDVVLDQTISKVGVAVRAN